MAESIKTIGSVYKVQTLVDFGFRITLDIASTEIMAAAAFMECKQLSVALQVEAIPIVQDTSKPDTADGKKQRPELKSMRGN